MSSAARPARLVHTLRFVRTVLLLWEEELVYRPDNYPSGKCLYGNHG